MESNQLTVFSLFEQEQICLYAKWPPILHFVQGKKAMNADFITCSERLIILFPRLRPIFSKLQNTEPVSSLSSSSFYPATFPALSSFPNDVVKIKQAHY